MMIRPDLRRARVVAGLLLQLDHLYAAQKAYLIVYPRYSVTWQNNGWQFRHHIMLIERALEPIIWC